MGRFGVWATNGGLVWLCLCLFACGERAPYGSTDDPGEARAVFELDRNGVDGDFFNLPWPNDLRRDGNGHLVMDGFTDVGGELVGRYVDAFEERLTGFGTHTSVYFRFSRSLDEASLPDSPEASRAADATVFLMDIEPESPTFGERHPVHCYFQADSTRYWSSHMLAIRPLYGMPLRGGSRYAAVVTRGVRAVDGLPLERDGDFTRLLDPTVNDALFVNARSVYGDVFEVLAAQGVAEDTLLSVSVFTTMDPVGELNAIRDWMVENRPAPSVVEGSLRNALSAATHTEIRGRYGPVPNFQEGEIPFESAGGAIRFDASGAPIVQGEYEASFALSVPRTPMPEGGYPVLLYAHGTGGSRRSFINNGIASMAARQGMAAMGIDQIHHALRNPTDTSPDLLFFNFSNPDSVRDSTRQSALDIVAQARAVANLEIPVDLLAHAPDAPATFNASRIFFMGHSQGGLNGPLFLAIDDSAQGAVLSAASGVITISLLEKVEPVSIPNLVRVVLGLPGTTWETAFEREGFREEHPIATLIQTWIEVSDPSNYGPMIIRNPRPGFAPKSVFMTEGMRDAYSPPGSIEALAGAMGIPQVLPVQRTITALSLQGVAPVSTPVLSNINDSGVTAGLLQFPDHGHFAIFNDEDAEAQLEAFFASLVAGTPEIVAP